MAEQIDLEEISPLLRRYCDGGQKLHVDGELILLLLSASGEPRTYHEYAMLLGQNSEVIRKHMERLAARGLIRKMGRGYYQSHSTIRLPEKELEEFRGSTDYPEYAPELYMLSKIGWYRKRLLNEDQIREFRSKLESIKRFCDGGEPETHRKRKITSRDY